jgi:hypothetical protein
MGGIFGVEDLQARKRALVEESEVYREALKIEFRNLSLYAGRIGRTAHTVKSFNPLLMMAAPLARSFLFGRSKTLRFLGRVYVGFKLYRQFAPLLRGVVSQLASRASERETTSVRY